MGVKYTNFAQSIITNSGGISDSQTQIILDTGDGDLFPVTSASDFFYCVLVDTNGNREVVKVTTRTGDVLTVVRGQDGTSPRAFAENDVVKHTVIAGNMNDSQDMLNSLNTSVTAIMPSRINEYTSSQGAWTAGAYSNLEDISAASYTDGDLLLVIARANGTKSSTAGITRMRLQTAGTGACVFCNNASSIENGYTIGASEIFTINIISIVEVTSTGTISFDLDGYAVGTGGVIAGSSTSLTIIPLYVQ